MHKTLNPESVRSKEPIAIVGIGCRFPGGVDNPASYWRLLSEAVDAISQVPKDRWNIDEFYDPNPGTPGKSYSKWGGFLDQIDGFEPECFGISPREATYMDPQQRLLLEVAWEAIEDAGWSAGQLAGSDTGVFVGVSVADYSAVQGTGGSEGDVDPHMATGGALSITANRLSYCLNLIGPSVAVDTACSSSLVAIDIACRRIWDSDCRTALAGGVNIMITPGPFLAFSAASMLAADGRCKTFDASADGFVRGEGAGIVVLKRLSDALADRDPIYAVIAGTGVNQDGRTSGIALPNEASQAALVREVCDRAGVVPSTVDYVEAHGTGTAVGDPIEATALGSVLGSGRDDGGACLIGSVKTNIGHLESGAGIAGLIKAALVLKHRAVPPHLNMAQPNPAIAFDGLNLRVPLALEALPDRGRPAVAAVNSFGFGGTNAHAVLMEYRSSGDRRKDEVEAQPYILPLSARSPEALEVLANAYADDLRGDADKALGDICFTAAVGRVVQDHRAVAVARDRPTLIEKLEALGRGEKPLGTATGKRTAGKEPRIAFVFSGQGPQWWAMGRQLLEGEPVYRAVIEECDRLVSHHANWSLLEELSRDEQGSRIQETRFAQPALFALQVGMAALFENWGIAPEAVLGHSVGEIAAAYVSGALTLDEASRVAVYRGQTMDRASSRGRMLAVGLSVEEAGHLIAGHEQRVSIAAINGPNSVTLSGEAESLEKIAAALQKNEVFNRPLKVEYAFHSPQMDPVEAPLLESLSDLRTESTARPIYSTVTGGLIEGSDLGAGYWWRNVRNTVRFADAFVEMASAGFDTFVEISPHPVLSSVMRECLAEGGQAGSIVSTLRRNGDEPVQLRVALGALFAAGTSVDWQSFWPEGGQRVHLPTYPWRRQVYWHESLEERERRLAERKHHLLGRRLRTALPTWRGNLDLRVLRYLEDHRVKSLPVFPAAGYVEMGLAVADEVGGDGLVVLEDVRFRKVLHLPSGEAGPQSQVSYDPADGQFNVFSGTGDDDEWMVHATGYVSRAEDPGSPPPVDLARIEKRLSSVIEPVACYRRFDEIGLQYGPCFRGVEALHVGNGEALGVVRLPGSLVGQTAGYHAHPALLDACFQTFGSILTDTERLYLPVHIGRVRFHGSPGDVVRPHVVLRRMTPEIIVIDLKVYDESGKLLIDFQNFVLQETGSERAGGIEQLHYEVRWYDLPALTGRDRGRPPTYPTAAEVARVVVQDLRLGPTSADPMAVFDGSIARHARDYDRLDDLALTYVVAALRKLGLGLRLGDRIAAADLRALGVDAFFERLMPRFLDGLAAAGHLAPVAGDKTWEVIKELSDEPASVKWRQTLFDHPDIVGEINLVGRSGSHLAEVLRGETDPLQLIFPDGSMSVAEAVYQDSPCFFLFNSAVQAAIELLVKRLPPGRKIRVLEVGGGTGGLSGFIASVLPPHRSEYVFTDISRAFFSAMESKLRRFDFIDYQTLDLEKDPREQGFELASFDVIVASDVLHATERLKTTLGNIGDLLVSEGLFIFIEVERGSPWLDVVFGTTKGWWRFLDHDLRPHYPLLSRAGWTDLLGEMGFSDIESIPGDAEPLQTVMWARGPIKDTTARESTIAETAESDESSAAAGESDEPGTWLIFADEGGIGAKVGAALRNSGDVCFTVRPGDSFRREGDSFSVSPQAPEAFHTLISEVGVGGRRLRGVVHLWALDVAAWSNPALPEIDAAESLSCHSLLHVIQAINADARWPEYRLMIVTRDALPVDGQASEASLFQSELVGMARVICNEQPDIRCKIVDIPPSFEAEDVDTLIGELLTEDAEQEVAIRAGCRYVPRIERATPDLVVPPDLGEDERFRLQSLQPGMLDRLALTVEPREAPGPGEIEIAVRSAALNFRDVLKALDAYPKDSPDAMTLGDECAGIVTAVGENVETFAVGDEVVAFATGSLASHVTTSTTGVMHKPDWLSFDDAVTMPAVFLTAHYALNVVGRIRAGEDILIHAATGGVGLAALQVAANAGAGVFVTAGSSEKQGFLRLYGLDRIMNSRSLAFADEIESMTNGRGVDLVLNSLAGKAIAKGLSCLAPFGRFLEIGKRDIYEDNKIGLWPFHKNLALHAIDLGSILVDRSPTTIDVLNEVSRMMHDREIHPLPYRVFPVSRVADAMRYMGQARHIGKIVVSMQDKSAVARRPARSELSFSADATYLITGGFGGLGLAMAQWIVENGGRHLVLVGRGGAQTDETRTAIGRLVAAGAEIREARVDISDADAVAAMLTDVRQTMPPLKGVMHTAMVLDDGGILQLDRERFRHVTKPKVDGAWNLHTLTGTDSLDFFVLFSSMSSVVAQQGQANYVAANTFLDTLAYYRRARGLPGLTVNLGAVTDVGFIARSGKYTALAERSGITSAEVAASLSRLIPGKAAQVGVVRADWRGYAAAIPNTRMLRRLSSLVDAAPEGGEGDGSSRAEARQAILGASKTEQMELLRSYLRDQVGHVIGMNATSIEDGQPLNELGLDSLMALELRIRIEGDLLVSLPVTKLMQGPIMIDGLSRLVIDQLVGGEDDPADRDRPVRKSVSDSVVVAPKLVRLQPKGSGHALICIHPAGGHLSVYDQLAAEVAPDLPVVGIQGGTGHYATVRDMTADYLPLVRAHQRSGPYHLFGFSVGGFLAIQLAAQLEAEGETVAFLGLADSKLVAVSGERVRFLSNAIVEIFRDFCRQLGISPDLSTAQLEHEAGILASEVMSTDRQSAQVVIQRWLTSIVSLDGRLPEAELQGMLASLSEHLSLASDFTPPTVGAALHVWMASRSALGVHDTNWADYTRGPCVQETFDVGHHDLMRLPTVRRIANDVKEILLGAPAS